MAIKINIVGMGIMGKNVARALLRDPRVAVTAVASATDKTLAAVKEEFGFTRLYKDYLAMLDAEKPDAVFIATPDWAHRDPVMACLDRGIHVHVEKPMTTSEAEAAEIVRKVRETGLKLQVSYNHRWLAPYYTAFDKIRGGGIGECVCASARKNNPITVPTKMLAGWAKDSSPMWFQSAHDIDLIGWYFDDIPTSVSCQGVKKVLKETCGWDTFDAMQGRVRFSRGGLATLEAAWIYPEKHPAMPDSFLAVVGEKGHIHIDRKAEAIEMSTPEGLAWPRSFLNARIFGEWTGAFPSCIRSFISAIEEDFEPHVGVMDGWKATAILDALHRSAELDGETIQVSPPPTGAQD